MWPAISRRRRRSILQVCLLFRSARMGQWPTIAPPMDAPRTAGLKFLSTETTSGLDPPQVQRARRPKHRIDRLRSRDVMNDFRHNLRSVAALFVAVFFLAGCGRTTVTPTFPVSDNVTRPDRILIYDFAVRPDGSEVWEGPDAQTPEDIRVGNMFAKSLTDSLVAELRNRGINAYRGAD